MRVRRINERQIGLLALFMSFLVIGGCGDGSDSTSSSSTSSSGVDTVSITGSPTATIAADQTYNFVPAATSSSGKSLAFTVLNLPSWATFNAATGQISGTPTDAEAGSYAAVTITVSDGTATAQLSPFAITVTPIASGTATLTWEIPAQNTNGTATADLAGYYVHYGTSADALTETINVSGGSVATYEVTGLAPGTYYFVVNAYNSQGVESPASNMASKTI